MVPAVLAWHANASAPTDAAGVLALRVDNDFLVGTDAQYTSGLAAAYAWPSHRQTSADGSEYARNHVFGMQQAIYTPDKNGGPHDRPYASTLTAAWTYHVRGPDHLDSWSLIGGVLGPPAMGEQVQNGFHRLFGSDRRLGWDQQVRTRALVNAQYAYLVRGRPWALGTHFVEMAYGGGVAAGNLRDEAQLGLQLMLSSQPGREVAAMTRELGMSLAPGPTSSASSPATTWYVSGNLARNWYDAAIERPPADGVRRIDPTPWRWEVGIGVQVVRTHWCLDAALVTTARDYRQQAEPMHYVRLVVRHTR